MTVNLKNFLNPKIKRVFPMLLRDGKVLNLGETPRDYITSSH